MTRNTHTEWLVPLALVIATIGLVAVIGGVATAQETSPTPTPTPTDDTIEAVVDDDLRVLRYRMIDGGTKMRLVLESDERQDVVISEVVDDPGSGGQKFAIRAIEAPSDGKRVVELPASGGATIVTRECRDAGACVFLPADSGGGEIWPNKGRDALSAGVALLLTVGCTFGIARRKKRNPNKCESAHDSGGRF